jgi:hypothetical protein
MTVTIKVKKTDDGWEASSRHPEVCATSHNVDDAINFVKGACLIAIGHWPKVPDVAFHVSTPKELA